MAAARVYVCGEKGCGKKGQRRTLVAALDGCDVVEVGCQSVCDGPVAGVVLAGRLEWFEEVRSEKARAAIAAVAAGKEGRLPKALAKRRRPKRSGKLRG